MRAVTFQRKRRVSVETLPDPRLETPADALVRVRRSAICGSDLHVYHEREKGLDPGTAMGHEFVGEIVEVGRDVHGLAPGDLVLSPFTTSCGNCFFCRSGLTARCERGQLFGWVQEGRGLQGGQAELVRVPLATSTLRRCPAEIGTDEALLLGDVLSTGYYCAEQGHVGPGTVCVVLGCGPVGLMAIVGARELGAERVLAVDRVADRLRHAESFGAEALSLADGDLVARVREMTEGRGADTALEAVGSSAALRSAYELVRPGGTISVVGVHTEDRFAFTPNEAYDKNVTTRVGRCPARDVLERLIPLARSGRYDLASLFTHRLPLERGAEAYRLFDEKRDGCIKVALET